MISKYFKPAVNYSSWADRFSSIWTFLLFLFIALVVVWRHFIGPNVSCFLPSTFTPQMAQYANDKCWSARQLRVYNRGHTLYEYYRLSDGGYDHQKDRTRTLYQWLPVIIACQALLFRLPDILLRIGDALLGFGSSKIVGLIGGYKTLSIRDRISLAREMANYFGNVFSVQPLKVVGVTAVLIAFVKLLFFVNAAVQLILLDGYLAPSHVTSYGYHVVDGISRRTYSAIEPSPAFPRQVYCYIDLNRYQPLLNYTLQCSVLVNDFNEQVCFFMWIWLLIVCIVAGASLIVYLIKAFIPRFRERYILRYLEMANLSPAKSQLTTFTKSIIGNDGVLLLKMIGEVSSDILVRDIVVRIWYIHYDQEPRNKSLGIQYPETVGGYRI